MESAKAALTCKMCGQTRSDICITPCGCTLHAWCIPLDLLGSRGDESEQNEIPSLSKVCPCCNTPLSRIEILEMSSEMIDRVVEIHRQTANGTILRKTDTTTSDNSRSHQDQQIPVGTVLPELKYLILSSSYNPMEEFLHSSLMSEADFHRLGRWTKEEVEFVDFICTAFEEGQLPIPNGVSLKEFLCHILLCKGSRLTKRLKNAKLSVRTYEAKFQNSGENDRLDNARLGDLQERFLQSINNEPSRLEARFYNEKTWKSMFSSLCIQLDCQIVDARKWLASIEVLDRKYSSAAEIIRNKRRRNAGVTFAITAQANLKKTAETAMTSTGSLLSLHQDNQTNEYAQPPNTPAGDTYQSITCNNQEKQENSTGANEFAGVFDDSNERSQSYHFVKRKDSKKTATLLLAIRSFVEQNNLPFHYFELWAPSVGPPNCAIIQSDVSLYHAGYTYRTDLDSTTKKHLIEFGEYQDNIQIEPGVGLPGRALISHKTQWECSWNNSEEYNFHQGSKQPKDFGLKTAVTLPIISTTSNSVIVIVALFSLNHVAEDFIMLQQITAELSRYTPKPKWKSIVEVGKPISPGSGGNSTGEGGRPLVQVQGPGSTHSSTTDLANESSTFRMDSPPPPSIDTGTEQNVVDERDEEISIANLLGSNMPNPLERQPSNCVAPPIDCYISLRLLFLRPSSTRTEQENGIVEIIRQSYRAYCYSHKWSSTDIALLVVKDWMHLRDTIR